MRHRLLHCPQSKGRRRKQSYRDNMIMQFPLARASNARVLSNRASVEMHKAGTKCQMFPSQSILHDEVGVTSELLLYILFVLRKSQVSSEQTLKWNYLNLFHIPHATCCVAVHLQCLQYVFLRRRLSNEDVPLDHLRYTRCIFLEHHAPQMPESPLSIRNHFFLMLFCQAWPFRSRTCEIRHDNQPFTRRFG